MTSEPTRDPIHRVRYAFEPEGENMLIDTWIEPGGGLPAHLHPKIEERWWVIEGEARIQLGDVKRVIGPSDGQMIVAPGTKHALASAGEREAHLRCLVLPGGKVQEFLEESAAAAREGLFLRGGIPRNLRGARWAAGFVERTRDDVVMLFPPAFVQNALVTLLAGRGRERRGV